MSKIELMEKRTSIRSYSTENLPPDTLEKVKSILKRERKGPFGTQHFFSLIDTSDKTLEEMGKMTSYGIVKGAKLYITGYSDSDDKSIIDFGYCFQELILELTALNLGTCWLGGTFGRSFIAKAVSLPEGKVIPAISPIGISLGKRVMSDKIVRFIAKSDKRKDYNQLFFSYTKFDGLIPIDMNKIVSPLKDILESVRKGPSASNKQPWRIITDEEKIHLFWDYDRKYNSAFKIFNIQALDMGIALCHFNKSSEELNFRNSFVVTDPRLNSVQWKYVSSWKILK